MTDYRMSLSREIEARLKVKCDKLSDAFELDDSGNYLFLTSLLLFKSFLIIFFFLSHIYRLCMVFN